MNSMRLLPALLPLVACADAMTLDPVACGDCVLTDINQFAYLADLDADTVSLAAGEDAEIDWTALTRDLEGHEVDPEADLTEAVLVAFRDMEPDEVIAQFAADTLQQQSIAAFLSATSTTGRCRLSDFGVMGNRLDVPGYFQPGTTWVAGVRQPGSSVLASFTFLRPSSDSDGALAVLDDDSAALELDVDFGDLEPVQVEAGVSGLVLDWSEVSVDGLGNPISMSSLTELFLGRYDTPRAALEEAVFDLDTTAAESWTMRLDGSTWANLGSLSGSTPFAGISTGSTWLLALRCSECMNPTPRVVTFLEAAPS